MSSYKTYQCHPKTSPELQGLYMVVDNLNILLSMMKANFPMMGNQFDGISDSLRQAVDLSFEKVNHESLSGHGSRATVLREVASMFPDFDVEDYIQTNLPVKHEAVDQYQKSIDFSNLVRQTFDESTDLFNPNFGFLASTSAEQLGDLYLGQLPANFFLSPKSGIYNSNLSFADNDHYNKNKPNTIVLVLNDRTVFVYNGTSLLFLRLPIEGCWVKTSLSIYRQDHEVYFDWKAIIHAFYQYLTDSLLMFDLPITLERIFNTFLNQVDKEQALKQNIVSVSLSESTQVIQHHRDNSKSGFTYITTLDPDQEATEHTWKTEDLMFRSNIASRFMQITRVGFEDGTMVYKLMTMHENYGSVRTNQYSSNQFNTFPYRHQSNIMDWMQDIFKKHLTSL